MDELQTRATGASVADFLNAIPDPQVREDCWTIARLMEQVAKAKPKMWGPSIVGFGEYTLVYPDGREMSWMLTAFSPRKQNITLYVLGGNGEQNELLAKLGAHSCSKSCLHIKRLSDVHMPTLKKIVQLSVAGKAKRKKTAPNKPVKSASAKRRK